MSGSQQSASLPLLHMLVALAVVAVWGTNFVVIKLALDQFPPLLFAALRFGLAFFPAALLLPRPKVGLAPLAGYGLLIGLGQFGLLYIAMDGLISPGLASVIVQMQVFFTIGLSMWLRKERLRGFQYVSLLLGLSGIGLIVANTGGDTTMLGVALVLLAGLSWALGNIVSASAASVNILAFVVWSSIFAVPPLLLLSLLFEGWGAMSGGLASASYTAWAAVLWQSLGNTLFGYGLWGWLLQRHPAALVAPTALLVPVFGMVASALLLSEPMPLWKIAAALLVIAGLAVGVLYPALRARPPAPAPGA